MKRLNQFGRKQVVFKYSEAKCKTHSEASGSGLKLAGGSESEDVRKPIQLENHCQKMEEIRARAKENREKTRGDGLSPQSSISSANPRIVDTAHSTLPGDELRKKLLKKMVKEKKMKALGDRVKTKPIESIGGSLIIPSTSSGQSRSKTYPKMKAYKLNPQPLIGAGLVAKPKGLEGGFIISGLIALGTAIAGAASAAAATTVVGGVTVGSLVGSTLTGAAGVGGATLMKKLLGKKGDGLSLAGSGLLDLKEKLVDATKKMKVTIQDMSIEDKKKLKTALTEFSKNKNKKGAVQFAKTIAPIALKIARKKLKPKVEKVLKKVGLQLPGKKGAGLSLAGSGLSLAGGSGEKVFKKEFVKNLVSKLEKMKA